MINFRTFAEEFEKLAEVKKDKEERDQRKHRFNLDKGVIYDPGLVAHEAGHAKLHKEVPGVTGLRSASNFLSKAAPAGYLATQILRNKDSKMGAVAGLALAGSAPMLADEAYASVKGYKALKDSGKYTKKELRDMRHKLIAAGGTYAMTPASFIGSQAFLDVARKTGSRWAYLGSIATPFAAEALAGQLRNQLSKEKGPSISALEAKELARQITPNTDVYATDNPLPQGAFAMPKQPKWIRPEVEEGLKPVLREKEDRKRLARRGGIVIAPTRNAPRGRLVE